MRACRFYFMCFAGKVYSLKNKLRKRFYFRRLVNLIFICKQRTCKKEQK
ncbi:hypothetical protein HMPREF9554_02746 [Treponema phagedenis F0421]|nr:hypothetical protein HMPREF9554_02746 [Treponema phagedenis F0421]